jgi:DNA transformation protein and related proteins
MSGGRDDSFVEFVVEQLRGLPGLRHRRMFGGHGLYQDRLFFGIVAGDRLYFKTDAASVGPYTARGMAPFRPNERQTLKHYYEVPTDVLEDAGELAAWALDAVRCHARQAGEQAR